jgi:hypothetical protein
MKTRTVHTLSLVVITLVSVFLVAGTTWALDWTYFYDGHNDASHNWQSEIYRMGYAFDDDSLYFNMLTGVRQDGWGKVQAGDLFLNVGGSLLDGYSGSGYDAEYASGNVFGLALTSHAGDMNADLTPTHGAYRSGSKDDDYAWSSVTQGHLYSEAVFSTGIYEAYEGTHYWRRTRDEDGGSDPFGDNNNAPAHIAEFGADLGYQGDVTWDYLGDTPVNEAGTVSKKAYEVNAVISLDALGVVGGESIEMWWSMECGNDFFMIDPSVPESVGVPEPGTLLLLGVGLLSVLGLRRKR